MSTLAPPVLSLFPDYLFALAPENELTSETIMSPINRRHLVMLDEGCYALAIGMHLWNSKKKTLASIGREDCDITVSGWRHNISRVHCTFHIHPESGAILFQDRSVAKSTLVSHLNTKEYGFETKRETRQVMVHPEFNDFISFGGVNKDLYRFRLVWKSNIDSTVHAVRDYIPRPLDFARPWCDRTTVVGSKEREAHRYHLRVQQNLLKHPMRFFQKGEKALGSGGFGSVFPAFDVDSGRCLAVKKIRYKEDEDLVRAKGNVEAEAHVAALLNHKHILDFYGHKVFKDPIGGYIAEIYTPLQDGSVVDLLKFGQLSLDESNLLLKHSLIGLDYLHWMNYIHQDIKPHNILYTRQTNGELLFKLADFGLCRQQEMDLPVNEGTRRYMAPEAFGIPANRAITKKVDIWSLYVTMVWVMRPDYREQWTIRLHDRGDPANVEMDPEDIVQEIGGYATQPDLKHLKNMVNWIPEERPTTGELLWDLFQVKGLPVRRRKQGASSQVMPAQLGAFPLYPTASPENNSNEEDISVTVPENNMQQFGFIEPPSASLYCGRTDTTVDSPLPHRPADEAKGKKRDYYERDSTRYDPEHAHHSITAIGSQTSGPSKRRKEQFGSY